MKPKPGKYGLFLSCSNYPACKGSKTGRFRPTASRDVAVACFRLHSLSLKLAVSTSEEASRRPQASATAAIPLDSALVGRGAVRPCGPPRLAAPVEVSC